MNLSEYIGQYEKAESQKLMTFPAFFDRLTRARRIMIEKIHDNQDRSLKSPFYLSDLGVRNLKSPKLYAQMIVEEFNTRIPDINEVEQELMEISIEKLGSWLDLVMLLLGDYDLVTRVCFRRKDEILAAEDFQLNIFAGTALAAINDEKYHLFFRNAMNLKDLDFEDRAVLSHRIAVSELKRSHNFDKFDKAILEVLSNYDMDDSTKFIVVIGLLDNLSGLEQVEQKRSNVLLHLTMINADILLNAALKEEANPARYDMLLRYLGQVAINRSQLEMFDGNKERAITILKSSLKRNLENNSDYSGETFGILSVLEYQEKHFLDAIEHASQAIAIYKSIGDVVAAEQAYKVLVGANDKIGNHEIAEDLALKLKKMDRSLFL
ncbi:MAG: hypothetical protein LBV19_11010 [Streptococcaceae bacterium]|jgi:tetratricopeptide (TPR) repeat protein|nr:hypothetical protein [Streptococcaceae bacterium]